MYQAESVNPKQFDTKTIGIIDILATDTKADSVIIEVKASAADERVCGQI
jgi:RecB family endonuclease NucS